ncbi:MAG TPA: nitrate- and nitrite sensing domain-containing protein [Streptosporangiaceae bacterium]|nr:nitrate- and nitrite sensing domain-containing protein [Streptosporangiaceae bacterium]
MTRQREGGAAPGVPPAADAAVAAGEGAGDTAALSVAAGSPASPVPPSPGDADDASKPAARRGGSRLALSNWRVRRRLIALIAVPTIAAGILGGLRISSALGSAIAFKRVQQLAVLNSDVIRLAQNMEDERDLTAGFIAAGRPAGALHDQLTAQWSATNAAAQQVTGFAGSIGGSYPAVTRQDLSAVLARISDLDQLRSVVVNSQIPTTAVIGDYTNSVATLLTFTSIIGTGSNDSQLANDVIVLTALARAEDQASEQRGTLYSALVAGRFPPGGLASLQSEEAQQAADQADFQSSASLAEQQAFQNTVSGTQVDQAALEESLAASSGSGNGRLTIGVAPSAAASDWYQNMTFTVGKMRSVEQGLVGGIVNRSQALQSSAIRSAVIISAITLALLLLVLLITTFVARSMIRPLRRLREDALDIAGTRLPGMVRRLSEAGGEGGSAEIEPIGVASTDEIGEVARAFDQVHREAVRLAADEAMLRGNLNAMFVNLSRRSQSLIERQIALIDSLEQGEQDSERLSSLFRLDHLATRMRRNSENLLVLAGHEMSRRWSQPVPLVDVLRAAVSEIEQYERVVLNVQPGIAVVGQAVNDVVHLVAELLENATTFSPEDAQVYVSGQPLTSGGVLIDITDSGVGISDQEMAQMNWRLDNPPVVDVAVSRRMGLFVVGRLAARHGVRIRLRHAPSGGLTALVWLPDTVAAQEGPPLGRLRRFEVEDYGAGPSLSAPPVSGSGGALPSRPGLAAAGEAAARAAAAARLPRFSPPSSTPPNPVAGNGSQWVAGNGPQPASGSPANGAGRPAGPGNVPGQGVPLGPAAMTDAPGTDAWGESAAPGAGVRGGNAGGPPDPQAAPGSAVPQGPPNASADSPDGNVRVPVPADNGHEQRLPIFDSLESDWFRRGGTTHTATQDQARPRRESWSSPADDGWRAAQTVASPAAGGMTAAGLPRRVPRANLVPGSAGDPEMSGGGLTRSPEEVRNRLAGFQRGVREARAAAPKTEEP